MNVKIILLCLSCCFAAVIAMSILESIDEQWEQYKRDFHKKYHPSEEAIRRKHFEHRVKNIHLHNERFARKEVPYELGINQFTDMTDDEILKKNKQSKVDCQNHNDDDLKLNYDQDVIQDMIIDPNFDWRLEGAVSGVKDQEDCNNSDYAFAAVGALEGQLFRRTQKLTELSVQDLIDCSKKNGNNGCESGDVCKAIMYVSKDGILTEQSYPFEGEESETCPVELRDGITKGTKIDCKSFSEGDEKDMRYRIFTEGPITAKINASPKFICYKRGIFIGDDCEQNEPNHNVLIVGYGVTNTSTPEEYWIIKNSWSDKWGEAGYARIARNKNTCGIAMCANYVTIGSRTKNKNM